MKAFLILFLALAGCTVGPDYEKPRTEIPATYKAVGLVLPPPTGSWWLAFADRDDTLAVSFDPAPAAVLDEL